MRCGSCLEISRFLSKTPAVLSVAKVAEPGSEEDFRSLKLSDLLVSSILTFMPFFPIFPYTPALKFTFGIFAEPTEKFLY